MVKLAVKTVSLVLALATALSVAASPADEARRILDESGVKGGVIVHLGCGDGTLTAALGASERFLVHGLDGDAWNVARAREHIRSRRLYGPVSVELWTGDRLPHADQLVNLVVASDPASVPASELMRVLAPGGVAMKRRGGDWVKTVKPWPENVDEWSHFLHDSTGNAVARDDVVGPPRRLQWVDGPRWSRAHEQLASVSVVVSAGGRLFSVIDEGVISSIRLPARWTLVARDAFNGVFLWKRAIPLWESHLRGFRTGPAPLPRRLVAAGERVYVTLGYGAPVTVLDAATGETIRICAGTAGAEEIVHRDGVLYIVVGDAGSDRADESARRRGRATGAREKCIVAMRAESGDVLWRKCDAEASEVMPLTLAVSGERAFFHTTGELVCLDIGSGKVLWRAERSLALERPAWSTPTVVIHDDIVLVADRKGPSDLAPGPRPREVDWKVSISGGGNTGRLIAYAAPTGECLWQGDCAEGYNAPPDVFVADGLVWVGETARRKGPDFTVGRDLRTGEVKRRLATAKAFANAGMPHHRCYRNKATERFILAGRAGVEFIGLEAGQVFRNQWIRGTCQYGVLPCNGLLYVPPHSCACFIEAKLSGFNALAPEPDLGRLNRVEGPQLERGPAHRSVPASPSVAAERDAWPTYRQNPARGGATKSAGPASLERAWATSIGGRLTSPVVAAGKVFVASVDDHTVHALDAKSGRALWRHTVAGRVDSPPTIDGGRVLFGSADGRVHCLRATDGEVAWRFRAAPEERRVVADGQLESAWPVHGSVLVQDGVVYAVAGRSSMLDGGLYLYRLDRDSGRKLSVTRIRHADPRTGEQLETIRGFGMEGALPDILSSDGKSLFMRHNRFDLEGVEQEKDVPHLFTPTGFLDDTWWHRSYWLWGTNVIAGWGGWWRVGNTVPSGRILVVDDGSIYGFGRSTYAGGNTGQWKGGEEYRLFRAARDAPVVNLSPAKPPARPRGQGKKGAARRRQRPGKQTIQYRWSHNLPLVVRAMALAGETLYVAGPPSLARTAAGELTLQNPDEVEEALEGRRGGALRAVAAADGKKLAELVLPSPPVFDGLAAAGGRLYLALQDGRVMAVGE